MKTLGNVSARGTAQIKAYSKQQKIAEVVQLDDMEYWASAKEPKLLMPDQHVKMKVPLAWLALPRKRLLSKFLP